MSNLDNLRVYHLARELCRRIRHHPGGFGDLTNQLRRAALSVVTNIAEGAGFRSDRKQAHHYRISHGSVKETGAMLRVLTDLDLLPVDDPTLRLADRLGAMLWKLIDHLDGDGG